MTARHLLWLPAFLGLVPVPVPAQVSAPAPPREQKKELGTGEYDVLTDNRLEVTNLNPEPFRGLAVEPDGGVWAVNPYASTLVHLNLVTGVVDLVVPTALNPVSVALYEQTQGEPGPKVIAVCTGTHAAVLHSAIDGRVLDLVRLDSEPADIVVDHVGKRAFVSCQGSNTVVEIDLASFEVSGRYELPVGQRPGTLMLEPVGLDGLRVFVAQTVTGNNSTVVFNGGDTVGRVLDLEGHPGGELPDFDVFRIDPATDQVDPVLRGAGSLLFNLGRNPMSGDLWVLSTDSRNKDPDLDTEPELRGRFVTNQLVVAPFVTATGGLVQAPAGMDVDDHDPETPGPQYDPALSVNQARALAFNPDGLGFIASPFSDVVGILRPNGNRLGEFQLPARSQCYTLAIYEPDPRFVLALCLGTMTVEVLSISPFSAVPVRSIPLGLDPTPLPIRKGRDVFLDGQRSQDGRSSCASCHPRGMSDQLGWPIAGPPLDIKDVMVTQSLLSVADTYPFHWRGERDLADFSKAFGGLLGSPAAEVPDEEEVSYLVTFMRSLQAPANPLQSPRRVIDDSRTPVAPDGSRGSAVRGQRAFHEVPAFLGFSCGECHSSPTGSSNNIFAELPSFAPRAAQIEVPHLRQLQHKGLQTKMIDTGDGPEPVNQDGFGSAHAGAISSLFRFIFDGFGILSHSERIDIFLFTMQWDQGISPAAHWSAMLDQRTSDAEITEIGRVLLEGARKGWNDVVLFGEYAPDGTTLQPTRWLYEPATRRLLSDDPAFAPLAWSELVAATKRGEAAHAVVGLPPGNGERFGLDHDNDGLINGAELVVGTDPWRPDTDGDRLVDGHEVENGDDPLFPQVTSGDVTPPSLVSAALSFTTARVAKYHVRFSEDVTYTVDYQIPGWPGYGFARDYESSEDTFVLTVNTPSTPILAPLVYTVSLTMTDRAGNVTGPVALPPFSPGNGLSQEGLPPFLHVGAMDVEHVAAADPSTLEARIRLRVDSNLFGPDFVAEDGQMVFCKVAIHDDETDTFVQSRSFTSDHETLFDIVSLEGVVSTYAATPGPFLVSPLTDVNGETVVEFRQHGLLPGQKVRVSVMGIVAPGTPPPGHEGVVYELVSLGQMQPLMLEGMSEVELVMP